MNIKTPSVNIKGTTQQGLAVILALCDFGTQEKPRIPTDDEKWAAIRQVRDELLGQLDWTQIEDAKLTSEEKKAFREKRQALRDIPQTFSVPEDVLFG